MVQNLYRIECYLFSGEALQRFPLCRTSCHLSFNEAIISYRLGKWCLISRFPVMNFSLSYYTWSDLHEPQLSVLIYQKTYYFHAFLATSIIQRAFSSFQQSLLKMNCMNCWHLLKHLYHLSHDDCCSDSHHCRKCTVSIAEQRPFARYFTSWQSKRGGA